MNFVFQLPSLAKSAIAVVAFFLVSAAAVNAQDATIHNFTSCDMEVTVRGTLTCGTIDCTETVTVPANSSLTHTLSCAAGLSVISVSVTAGCTASSDINLYTPLCACATGDSYDDGSFTVGGWTVDAAAACSGSNVEVKIWD